jgi:hypothetical protein
MAPSGGLRCLDLNQRHQASFGLVALCVSGVSKLNDRPHSVTGRAFSLWQSVQLCWCRGPVSSLGHPCVCRTYGVAGPFRVSNPTGIARPRKVRCNAGHGHQIAKGHLGRPDHGRRDARAACPRTHNHSLDSPNLPRYKVTRRSWARLTELQEHQN